MALPLADLRGPIRALFSDIDGTLTTAGRIEASTYTALERLGDAGVPVVLSAPDSPAGSALRAIADKLAVRRRGLAGMSLGIDTTRH